MNASDPTLEPRLEGLARSIDALFQSRDLPAAPRSVAEADLFSDIEVEPLPPGDEEAGTGGDFTTDWVDAIDRSVEWAEPAVGDDVRVPREEVPDDAPRTDHASTFDDALGAWLAAPAASRAELEERVVAAGTRHVEREGADDVFSGIERLLGVGGGGSADPAARALARRLAGPEVATLCVRRLADERDEARREALLELTARVGAPFAGPIAEALAHTEDRAARRAYTTALSRMGGEGVAAAEEMIHDTRWFVVRNAVLILGEAGGERAVEHLTVALAHDDARVRREALLALAKVGGADAAVLVVSKLEDPELEVRVAAAMAAGALGVERALKPLVARLDAEEETEGQIAVLRALGQIGDPGAVPALEKKATGSFFSRPPTEIRIAAYRALAAIGTPHARRLLEEAREDRDGAVRSVVRGLLAEA